MNTEAPRRSGPHAPLPSAIAATPEVSAPASLAASAAPASGVAAPEDSRARAARRAAELRDRGAMDDGADKFYIDPAIIPPGWSYEWKMHSVLGKEDPSYQVTIRQNGWEPVPADRHPELMPTGYDGNTVLREGQILMERPLEITEERRRLDYKLARDQMRAKEEQIGAAPAGPNSPFDNTNKGKPIHIGIKKTFEVGIPDK